MVQDSQQRKLEETLGTYLNNNNKKGLVFSLCNRGKQNIQEKNQEPMRQMDSI